MSFDLTIKVGDEERDFNWIRNHGSLWSVTKWLFGIDITGGIPSRSYRYYKRFDRKKLLKNALEAQRLYRHRVENPQWLEPQFVFTYPSGTKYAIEHYKDWIDRWVEIIKFAQSKNSVLFVSD